MAFEMFKLIEDPDYVPYCGPCPSPILRVVRDPSGMFNTCPRCRNNVYLNCIRKSEGDRFYVDSKQIDPPKYWILNNGKDRYFDHAGSVLGDVYLKLREGPRTLSIIILPELKARG